MNPEETTVTCANVTCIHHAQKNKTACRFGYIELNYAGHCIDEIQEVGK